MRDRQGNKGAVTVGSAEAAAVVKSGQWIDYGFGLSQPDSFDRALAERRADLTDVKIRSALTLSPRATFDADPHGRHFHFFNWHFSPYDRRQHDAGRCNYIPMNFGETPDYYRRFIEPVDVACIKCAPMDGQGFFNFGCSTTYLTAMTERARVVIVEVCPAMPRVCGPANAIHASQVDFVIEGGGAALPSMSPVPVTAVDREVARLIANEIEDGACLQIGIGGMPNAVCSLLRHSTVRDLGVHTEMLVDGVIDLIDAGIVTNARKQIDTGLTVFSFAVGSRQLYETIDRNPAFANTAASSVVHCGRLRSPQMSGNPYNTPMRSTSFDGLLRAAAAIAALAAVMSLRIAAAENSQDEHARIADWHAKRLASLTSETGWLTPIALYWLKDGENSFGRASNRAFSVDDAALAADTGAFVLTDGRVRYVAHAPKAMTYLGKPVTSLDLISDVDEKPTELIAGSLHFMLIERAGHLGIRVRDSVSPNRLQFKGLQYFPFRADWHIQAHFEPYVPERRIPIVNILGMTEEMTSPGAIVFEREGRSWRLDAILEAPGDRELFVMFSDATSGKQTYGAGRFLYVGLPDADRIEVDFNEAFNPPCAFTDFATCPLPPQQNQLALAIDAGELKYERAH